MVMLSLLVLYEGALVDVWIGEPVLGSWADVVPDALVPELSTHAVVKGVTQSTVARKPDRVMSMVGLCGDQPVRSWGVALRPT